MQLQLCCQPNTANIDDVAQYNPTCNISKCPQNPARTADNAVMYVNTNSCFHFLDAYTEMWRKTIASNATQRTFLCDILSTM